MDLDNFPEDFVEGNSDPQFMSAPGALQADEPSWFPIARGGVEPLRKAREKLETVGSMSRKPSRGIETSPEVYCSHLTG